MSTDFERIVLLNDLRKLQNQYAKIAKLTLCSDNSLNYRDEIMLEVADGLLHTSLLNIKNVPLFDRERYLRSIFDRTIENSCSRWAKSKIEVIPSLEDEKLNCE